MAHQQNKLANLETLPAAQVLQQCEQYGSYQEAMLSIGKAQQQAWLAQEVSPELQQQFKDWAEQSIAEQAKIESSDQVDFDTFLKHYMQPQ